MFQKQGFCICFLNQYLLSDSVFLSIRNGHDLYATLFQEVFVSKTGRGGSLNGRIYVDFVSVHRIYTFVSETGLLYLLSDFVFLSFKLYLIYKIPVDFARVPSPKMMSDCHMLYKKYL